MTYRNDLDAAHARIEALELENRALVTENETLRKPAPVFRPSRPYRHALFDVARVLDAARVIIFLLAILLAFAR